MKAFILLLTKLQTFVYLLRLTDMEKSAIILIAVLTGTLVFAVVSLWWLSPSHPVPIISLVVLAVVAVTCATAALRNGQRDKDKDDDDEPPRDILRFKQ